MKLIENTPLGWASTMIAIAFIGGIILVVLGLSANTSAGCSWG